MNSKIHNLPEPQQQTIAALLLDELADERRGQTNVAFRSAKGRRPE
jgi:hypothetical protein